MYIREFLTNFHTEEEIINKSIPAPKPLVGIYFLIRDKEIVYVGKSSNINARITEHSKTNSDKDFDSFSYILLPEEFLDYNMEYDVDGRGNQALDNLEGLYILKYNPEYNTSPGMLNHVAYISYNRVKINTSLGTLGELYDASDSVFIQLENLMKRSLFKITGSEEALEGSVFERLIKVLKERNTERLEFLFKEKTIAKRKLLEVNPNSPHWKLGGQ